MAEPSVDCVFEAECPRCHANTTAHAKCPGWGTTVTCWQCKREFSVVAPKDRSSDA